MYTCVQYDWFSYCETVEASRIFRTPSWWPHQYLLKTEVCKVVKRSPWSIFSHITAKSSEGCPIYPIRSGSRKWLAIRDGSWPLVTVCQFVWHLKNIQGGDMECGFVGVKMSADCADQDDVWRRSGVKMSADRPNRDGSWRPVTAVTDGVYPRET